MDGLHLQRPEHYLVLQLSGTADYQLTVDLRDQPVTRRLLRELDRWSRGEEVSPVGIWGPGLVGEPWLENYYRFELHCEVQSPNSPWTLEVRWLLTRATVWEAYQGPR